VQLEHLGRRAWKIQDLARSRCAMGQPRPMRDRFAARLDLHDQDQLGWGLLGQALLDRGLFDRASTGQRRGRWTGPAAPEQGQTQKAALHGSGVYVKRTRSILEPIAFGLWHPESMRTHAAVLGLVTLVGCGPTLRSGPLYPGRGSSEPSLRCLPDPDIADVEYTRHLREGLALAEESFSLGHPAPPAARDSATLTIWADGPFQTWLTMKTRAVEAARRELDAAAEENHRQRIIAGAVVGMMYEDVARVLGSVPGPVDLEGEPEIRRVYESTLHMQSEPYFSIAERAYEACAANARQPQSMRHWTSFCRERRRNLPGHELASGESEVEVVRE
jgi:hypothetical protein